MKLERMKKTVENNRASGNAVSGGATGVKPPKILRKGQWHGYSMAPWYKRDKDNVTILY
ncbi:MAG: hypothetical protein GF344_17655, partial [Chitinivibrionales bacterium]|nr:hypothetical protein [Chitinivibrionales bacterium]